MATAPHALSRPPTKEAAQPTRFGVGGSGHSSSSSATAASGSSPPSPLGGGGGAPPPPPPTQTPTPTLAATAAAANTVNPGAAAENAAAAPHPAAMPSTSVHGPVPGASRQGRQRQRYGPDGERLVAGCVPVRLLRDPPRAPSDVLVLLVSSRGGAAAAAAAAAAAGRAPAGDGNGDADGSDKGRSPSRPLNAPFAPHAASARAPSLDGAPPSSAPAGAWVLPKGGWEDDEAVEAAARRETVEEAGVRGAIDGPPLGAFAFEGACKVHAADLLLPPGAAPGPHSALLAAQSSSFEASFGGAGGGAGGDAFPPAAAASAAAAADAAADGAAADAAEPAPAPRPSLEQPTVQRPTARRRRGLAHMFVLRVQEVLETWPEAAQRERRWVPLPEAPGLCRHAWMVEALRAYGERLFPGGGLAGPAPQT